MDNQHVEEFQTTKGIKPKKLFYGWPVMIACGLIFSLVGSLGLAAGQLVIPQMALDPGVNISRSLIGLGFTIFVLCQGLPAPLIGQLVAKKGARLSMIIGGIVVSLAGILAANFSGVSTFAYFALFGVLMSVGGAMGSQVPCQTTISKWFIVRRGFAMTFMMICGGVLGFAYPLIVNALIGSSGWQAGWYFVAGGALLGIVLAFIFIRNKPEDKGQLPDNGLIQDADGDSKAARLSKVYKTTNHKTLSQALRTPVFWLLLLAGLGCYFGLNLQTSSAALHFYSLEISTTVVALAISAYSIVGLLARLFVAFIVDRVEPARILACCCAIIALGCLITGLMPSDSPIIVFVFYVTIGIGFMVCVVVMPTAYANYFGHTNFPKILGVMLPILAVIASLLPTVAGIYFDIFGDYSGVFIGVGIYAIIGAVFALLVRFPKSNAE